MLLMLYYVVTKPLASSRSGDSITAVCNRSHRCSGNSRAVWDKTVLHDNAASIYSTSYLTSRVHNWQLHNRWSIIYDTVGCVFVLPCWVLLVMRVCVCVPAGVTRWLSSLTAQYATNLCVAQGSELTEWVNERIQGAARQWNDLESRSRSPTP